MFIHLTVLSQLRFEEKPPVTADRYPFGAKLLLFTVV